jgi:hypothetical protein
MDKFQNINNKFEMEIERYSNYLNLDLYDIRYSYNNMWKFISKIDYEKIALEITPSNAVKFTIILKNEIILSITKPFDKIEDLDENEVVFNLYLNRELLVSDTSKIDELVKRVNSYVKM